MSRENTMAYIKDIAIRLNDPTIYGGASLMVGAGFSKNAKGIGSRKTPPDWGELAEAMYDELYPMPSEEDKIKVWRNQRIIKTSGKNTLHLAEEYIAFFDRNKMNSLIERNIADELFIPGELHKRLLRLNWTDIFTTNYDTLLERTRNDIFPDRDYKIVLSQENLPGSGGGIPRIIKLHGSIPGVRPYIIGEEDFRSYPRKSAAFVNTVQQALIETTLCMVGFSGDDPNFLSWHGWLHDNLGDNCPQLYLIGLFNEMSDSEKDIFRERKIALVDLADLITGSEKDKYAEAYNQFLKLIEAESKKEIFQDAAPYYKEGDSSGGIIKNEGEYINSILTFSEKVLDQIGNIVLLPENERKKYKSYFSSKFSDILFKHKTLNSDLIHTIANTVRLQRICLNPLYDYQVKRLIKLCDSVNEKNINVSSEWIIQIYLYLLEMYRIDSDEVMYQKIVSKCEELQLDLSDVSRGAYHLELAKFAAGLFDVKEVKKQLEMIGRTNLKIEIAKAGLYIQIGEIKRAESILKECLNGLEKLKMDTAFNASYKSYLSLCYTTLGKWGNLDDDYSDREYRGNEFQTRRIILEMEAALREEILKRRVKDETKENIFEVNCYRSETINFGESKIQALSFEFVLMLDTLCLPLFSDQCLLLPTVMENIMGTSEDSYWKASFMIRADNKELIERILSRKSIALTKRDVFNKLYEKLWNCVETGEYKSFEGKGVFLSQKNALNVLSRIVVFLDDESIVDLVKYIVAIKLTEDDYKVNDLKGIISRLSTRFNKKVAERLIDEIFFMADSRLQLSSYFTQMKITITDTSKYYKRAISLIKEADEFKRDNGIAQLLCLWKNHPEKEYVAEIANLLWNKGVDKFPDTHIFYEMIWEKLPHPQGVNFAKLYIDFIYNGLMNQSSNESIFRFVNLFYLTSQISDGEYTKIEFSITQLKDILGVIEKEIQKDKKTDYGFVFFDGQEEGQNIRHISEFIAMIYALKADEDSENTLKEYIDRILQVIREKGASGNATDAVKLAINSDYSGAINILKPIFWSNDEKAITEASIGFQLILFIAKKKDKDLSLIKDSVLDVMGKLQYSDIKYVKTIWNLLSQTILIALSDDEELQGKIAEVYKNCMHSYSFNGLKGSKYYFEAMYNCNETLRKYVEKIRSKGICVGEDLLSVIEYIKSLEIPELSSEWD